MSVRRPLAAGAALASAALVATIGLHADPAQARLTTCDTAPITGTTDKAFALEIPNPDYSGSVLSEVHYTWDGVSVYPDCDGPVTSLQTRNTGDMTGWAILPDKKKAPLWVQINPGTNTTTTSKGQLANLGLSNASDVRSVTISYKQPTS